MVERRAKLKRAGLTRMQTICLAMRFYDGMTHRQVAGLLGISQQSVSEHLAKGLRALHAVGLRVGPTGPVVEAEMFLQPTVWMDRLGPDDVLGAL